MGDKKGDLHGSILTEDSVETKEPPFYKVLLHNDDYTTMEFVISILENIFQKSKQEATRIMLNVHTEGVGVAGIIVHELAKKNEFPLRCSMEKD